MYKNDHYYMADTINCHGYLASPIAAKHKQSPTILIAHDWSGLNDFAIEKAEQLAEAGYTALALDLYGERRVGTTIDEKMALMQPLINDRACLRRRLIAAYDSIAHIDQANIKQVGIIGFCFGGLCALDLARTGLAINMAISVHGLLNKPEEFSSVAIKAAILALHGYNDPMVTPQAVNTFCQEMTTCNADWQIHLFGNTMHGFTNPAAQDPNNGILYNALSEKRAWRLIMDFMQQQSMTT